MCGRTAWLNSDIINKYFEIGEIVVNLDTIIRLYDSVQFFVNFK